MFKRLTIRPDLFDAGPLPLVGLIFFVVATLEFLGSNGDPSRLFHLHWLEFFAVGIVIPTVIAARWLLDPRWTAMSLVVERILSAFVVMWLLRFMLGADRIYVVAFAIGELIVLFALRKFAGLTAGELFSAAVLSLVAWTVMMPQGVEYNALSAMFTKPLDLTQIQFAILLVVTIAGVSARGVITSGIDSPNRAYVYAALGLVAFLIAFRDEDFVGFYNWGYFFGPANIIREGGWMLHDVPSQYGLLNIWTMAALPFSTTMDSMRFEISFLIAVVTIVIFSVFFAGRLSPWRLALAVLVAIGFGEFEAGSTTGDSLFSYPASGPLRFFWVYAVLGSLTGAYLTSDDRRISGRWQIAAICSWLTGWFWSAESAIYCSCTFLPAYTAMRVLVAQADGKRSLDLVMRVVRDVAAIIGAWFGIIVVIAVIYLIGLGQLPDWKAFIEYGLLYAGGLVSFPADPFGSIWLVLLDLGLILGTFVLCARKRAYRALPLLIAAWGATWAEASYFMARSVNNNVNAFLPTVALVMGIILVVGDREEVRGRMDAIRLAAVPILVWGMLLTFGNTPAIGALKLPFMPGYSLSVTKRAPLAEADLQALLSIAHYRSGDPMISVIPWSVLPGAFRLSDGELIVEHPWLPVDAVDLFAELPPARRADYIRTFSKRLPREGWLLAPTDTATLPSTATCADFIAGAPPITYKSGRFSLSYCRPRIAYTPPVARPRPIQSAVYFGSLDEFYFDDKPNFGAFDDAVIVARGQTLDIRGWLVRLDALPYRDGLVALVDGLPLATAQYGKPRPDVPAAMHAAHHPGDYSTTSGFTAAVPTGGLTIGPHILTIAPVDASGVRQPLEPAFPFSVF